MYQHLTNIDRSYGCLLECLSWHEQFNTYQEKDSFNRFQYLNSRAHAEI